MHTATPTRVYRVPPFCTRTVLHPHCGYPTRYYTVCRCRCIVRIYAVFTHWRLPAFFVPLRLYLHVYCLYTLDPVATAPFVHYHLLRGGCRTHTLVICYDRYDRSLRVVALSLHIILRCLSLRILRVYRTLIVCARVVFAMFPRCSTARTCATLRAFCSLPAVRTFTFRCVVRCRRSVAVFVLHVDRLRVYHVVAAYTPYVCCLCRRRRWVPRYLCATRDRLRYRSILCCGGTLPRDRSRWTCCAYPHVCACWILRTYAHAAHTVYRLLPVTVCTAAHTPTHGLPFCGSVHVCARIVYRGSDRLLRRCAVRSFAG